MIDRKRTNIIQVIHSDLLIPQLEVTNNLWKGHVFTMPKKGTSRIARWRFLSSDRIFSTCMFKFHLEISVVIVIAIWSKISSFFLVLEFPKSDDVPRLFLATMGFIEKFWYVFLVCLLEETGGTQPRLGGCDQTSWYLQTTWGWEAQRDRIWSSQIWRLQFKPKIEQGSLNYPYWGNQTIQIWGISLIIVTWFFNVLLWLCVGDLSQLWLILVHWLMWMHDCVFSAAHYIAGHLVVVMYIHSGGVLDKLQASESCSLRCTASIFLALWVTSGQQGQTMEASRSNFSKFCCRHVRWSLAHDWTMPVCAWGGSWFGRIQHFSMRGLLTHVDAWLCILSSPLHSWASCCRDVYP